jgi:hypothetical protein
MFFVQNNVEHLLVRLVEVDFRKLEHKHITAVSGDGDLKINVFSDASVN